MAGTFGVMGSFSLFFSHHISTMEGGVVVTQDEELYHALLSLRAHGWTRDLPDYVADSFQAPFEFILPGFSVRPTEVHAAIGLEQMKKLPHLLKARRRNGQLYSDLFGHQREVGASSWFGFPFLVDDRDAVLARVAPEFDVRPVVAGNILRHPVIAWFSVERLPTPMADRIHDCGFYIGNHARDCTAELRRMYALVEGRAAA
jgi:CDP-6-deoxy-D-xylo-4-hexulose-3-dehydrase